MLRGTAVSMGRVTTISAWLFSVLFGFASCDIFSTRDPEPPTGVQTGNEIAASPEEAISRLRNALIIRDPSLYLNVIDTSFRYSATESAYRDNPAFFENWGYNQESTFISRLLSPGLLPATNPATLQFEHLSQSEWSDSVLYIESYYMHLETSSGEIPTDFDGQAELKIIRGLDGGWRITSWLDEAGGEFPTMSQLRATL
ncbi:hypothetical protein K8I28_13630 [bacterium]|nr:hypothetical protein [bacterium]